jgi:hypothetical protein
MLVSGKGPAAFADKQYHGLALLDVIAQPLDERSRALAEVLLVAYFESLAP